jgi:hypothetical protein
MIRLLVKLWYLSPQRGASSGCGWRNGFQMRRVAGNILIMQSRTAEKKWSSGWGLGDVLTTPDRKNLICYKTLHKAWDFDQIKKNEMGGLCGTYGRQETCMQGFGGGDLMERDHLEDVGIDWKIILKWIFKT